VAAASYPISVVHDSFGCHAGNMGDLFMLVREQFVKFYAHDPLLSILTENDAADLLPDRGSLDVNQILFSDYAFC
jgi:DNA-directed RNA polymerase